MKVIHYRNGDAIPNVTDSTAWPNLTTGARGGDKLHPKAFFLNIYECRIGRIDYRVPMRLLVEKSVNSKKSGSEFHDFC